MFPRYVSYIQCQTHIWKKTFFLLAFIKKNTTNKHIEEEANTWIQTINYGTNTEHNVRKESCFRAGFFVCMYNEAYIAVWHNNVSFSGCSLPTYRYISIHTDICIYTHIYTHIYLFDLHHIYMNIQDTYDRLEAGFFWFWVKNWRISFLVIALMLGLGIGSLISIPKESSPSIEFGIISINTIYPGVNPVDMDSLVTDEIEQAIKDIDGISKIESTSRVWLSSTIVTLDNEANTREVLTDIKAEVDKAQLPSDAEDPSVTEISAADDTMFQVLLYGDRAAFPLSRMKTLSQQIKTNLENRGPIADIEISGSADFDLQIDVDQWKAEQLWLTISQIANSIRTYNRNTPLGNFDIDTLAYDFRIDGELTDEQDLLSVPLGISTLTLRDVATISRSYADEWLKSFGQQGETGYNVSTLTIKKNEWANIFTSSAAAKESIEALLDSPTYAWLQYVYSQDLSETIKEDYADLAKSGLLTLVWVFCCLLLFVGLKEAVIATFAIPLAFMVTFIVLQEIDLTLNFLTNFSLVLTLGIAIDTTIVIIEWAYENLKIWFNPKTAVLMAVRDFKAPLIAGTMTTLVVFIPMMVLPGVLGKFLAYIPITVFITLVAALFISLTVNSALFYKLSKPKTRFVREWGAEQFLSDDDREILALERAWKTERSHETKSTRQRMLHALGSRYERTLRSFLWSKKTRILSVILPILALFATFILLSPQIWFTLFPGGDEGTFRVKIENAPWSTTQSTWVIIPRVEQILADIPELKQYSISVSDNTLSATIELLDLDERTSQGLRDVFEVEKEALAQLETLTSEWYIVESLVEQWWPPQWKPVGLNLTADDNTKFSQLVVIAKEFAAYLRSVDGTKNVAVSSKDTPGQFIFAFDRAALQILGVSPSDVTAQLSAALNGTNAGTITVDSIDADIKVAYGTFSDQVSPSDITNTMIITPQGKIPVSEVMDYSLDNAVWEISRIDTKISIKVDADLEDEFMTQGTNIQNEFVTRAEAYEFPSGLSFDAAGESDENAELLAAAAKWLGIALFLMLVILVLQFNSFRKPAIILYSVFLALLGVNIWLFLTWNPYSMPFGIWFISLTGIVVNDAIIFIDKINKNLWYGLDTFESIIDAWRSRLQPIILTTLTTLLWVLPIALQDAFWAWLWYTMIFGLFAGSAMTLFVIPSLTNELFKEKVVSWFQILFRSWFWFIYWFILRGKRSIIFLTQIKKHYQNRLVDYIWEINRHSAAAWFIKKRKKQKFSMFISTILLYVIPGTALNASQRLNEWERVWISIPSFKKIIYILFYWLLIVWSIAVIWGMFWSLGIWSEKLFTYLKTIDSTSLVFLCKFVYVIIIFLLIWGIVTFITILWKTMMTPYYIIINNWLFTSLNKSKKLMEKRGSEILGILLDFQFPAFFMFLFGFTWWILNYILTLNFLSSYFVIEILRVMILWILWILIVLSRISRVYISIPTMRWVLFELIKQEDNFESNNISQ